MLTRRIVLAALVLAAGPLRSPAGRAETPGDGSKVVVLAAASLKTALDRIAKDWSAATGTAVVVSYAASSALARQIESGAPADIFASADSDWMDDLDRKGLIETPTRTNVVSNTLVLIAGAGTATDLKIAPGFALAEAIGDSRLATGDPKSVPAGKYAKAALTTLGVWESVAPKIAGAENVRAALQFVARGEAKFGIVYLSDARAEKAVKIVGAFPADTHPPIVYPFARVAGSKSQAAAGFLSFLTSPAAIAVFESEGFTRVR